ncbi:MAG: hypothetical protein ACYCW6_13570, partial [Candidatus Xenobia bacterium]
AAMAMGLAFSAWASNENKAASFLPMLIIPQILLTGELPHLEGNARLVSFVGLSKWPFELLQHLFQTWAIFPSDDAISNPTLKKVLHDMIQNHQDWYDQLSTGVDFWRHISILAGFLGAFIAITCAFQLAKDQVKE